MDTQSQSPFHIPVLTLLLMGCLLPLSLTKGEHRGVAKGLSPPPPQSDFGGGAQDFSSFFPFKP